MIYRHQLIFTRILNHQRLKRYSAVICFKRRINSSPLVTKSNHFRQIHHQDFFEAQKLSSPAFFLGEWWFFIFFNPPKKAGDFLGGKRGIWGETGGPLDVNLCSFKPEHLTTVTRNFPSNWNRHRTFCWLIVPKREIYVPKSHGAYHLCALIMINQYNLWNLTEWIPKMMGFENANLHSNLTIWPSHVKKSQGFIWTLPKFSC